MKCPIDSTELKHISVRGVEVDRCPQCNGVWLDRGELEKIVELAKQEDGGSSQTYGSSTGISAKKSDRDNFETPRVGDMSGYVRQFGSDDKKDTVKDSIETPTVGGMSGIARTFEDDKKDDGFTGINPKKTDRDAFETPRVGDMSGIVRQLGGKVDEAKGEPGDPYRTSDRETVNAGFEQVDPETDRQQASYAESVKDETIARRGTTTEDQGGLDANAGVPEYMENDILQPGGVYEGSAGTENDRMVDSLTDTGSYDRSYEERTTVPVSTDSPWDTGYVGTDRTPDQQSRGEERVVVTETTTTTDVPLRENDYIDDQPKLVYADETVEEDPIVGDERRTEVKDYESTWPQDETVETVEEPKKKGFFERLLD